MRGLPLLCGPLAVLVSLTACQDPPAPATVPAPIPFFAPPLAETEPGEKLTIQLGPITYEYTVVGGSHESVEVEWTEFQDGTRLGPPVRATWSRNGWGLPPEFIVRYLARDRIDVAGESWDCWRLWAQGPKESRWYWVTDRLPVHGVLRIAPEKPNEGTWDPNRAADFVPPAAPPR